MHPMGISITDRVVATTNKAILLEQLRATFAAHDNKWIAKSQILETDSDLDELVLGQEISIEITEWLAEKLGIDA